MNCNTTYSPQTDRECCPPPPAGGGPLKARQIEVENNRITEAIGSLHAAVERLEKRLEPVMSNTSDAPKEGKSPDPILAPLAGRIRDWRHEIVRLIQHVDGIHNRIEL